MSTPSKGVSGTDYRSAQFSQLTPEQMQLFQQLLGASQGSVGSNIDQLSKYAQGDEAAFQALEAPAWRQFGQAQDQIANRFSGMNARRSSGHSNAQSGAAASFAENLQSNRVKMRQDSIESLLGLYGNLIGQRTQENVLVPKKKKWWEYLLGAGSQAVGTATGSYMGAR